MSKEPVFESNTTIYKQNVVVGLSRSTTVKGWTHCTGPRRKHRTTAKQAQLAKPVQPSQPATTTFFCVDLQ